MAYPLLLFLLMGSYCCAVLGDNGHDFVVVPASSFFAAEPACAWSPASRVTSDPNRASVPLVHRHNRCTPSGASGKPLSLAERLRRDRARARYIASRAPGGRVTTLADGGGVSVPTYLGSAVDSLEYVVTLGLGTPAVEQIVLIDTGSDLSWVQCKPCNTTECYPQKDPLFDPSSSSTYAPVLCDTDACRGLAARGVYNNSCTNGTGPSLCRYQIGYGDGSTTVGLYSTETLTLKPGVSVKNFSFGCGFDQEGPNDKYDGLLGLGGAPESLVSQTAAVYGAAFSYCLPPGNGTSGFLTLGAPSNSTAGFVFTPMHRLPNFATFYMVTLAGISVGGKPLDIPPTVFSKGMIIDSGTVITGLPGKAYSALRSAFRSAMSEYPLLPPTDDGLDTCYNFTGFSNVTVPKVALTFSGGATIDLDVPSGVLLEGCLAFVGGDDTDNLIGVIGNVNQRTFEVLYDSGKGNVGFRAGAC
ncbi:hypothetical protein ACP70R_047275 [Stipagrostis hirtigluma subsp. patula]